MRALTKNIVLGIDGGGTYTRVMAADTDGNVLAYTVKGCSNPHKDPNAEQNVKEAIGEAVAQAGATLERVVGVCAGLAGLDKPEDQAWADEFTRLPGLSCKRKQVNDSVVALAGALLDEPGIVAVSGTGSIIFGMTEAGRYVRNYDFKHYAATAARYLSYDAVHMIIAGYGSDEDKDFVHEVLRYFHLKDTAGLIELGSRGFAASEPERIRLLSGLAPAVTKAAANGSPLARKVCDRAVLALCEGIRIVGSCFAADTVQVAFLGGVIRDAYISGALKAALAGKLNKTYRVRNPALSPVAGAVLLALKESGVAIDGKIVSNLGFHPKSSVSDHNH